ncbi:MAG TPA: replication-associated recombination protein A [Candidatus Hydrogenedentes bacterium]|nr:replication-associated recombination protein A [Candidatus Hydrogenedentota bacterium]HOL77882.1 replication-associated recombination protein A [Candidatus Hydrogenedentota bacterium]HPO87047.1 replication-associated recombination protein A [Candidatus Hydrogenedentota bacterium]
MTDDLFQHAASDRARKDAPLARRVAPRTLDELLGQDHILGKGKVLRRAIEADRLTSLILYGPPGSGKTALARIIALHTHAAFETLNAVMSGVADIRRLTEAARQRRALENRRTIVFIDEIHRFNRAQQDALLPDVENGNIVLIGATTQNPFFSVTAPLLSRSQVFELKRLDEDTLVVLLKRALTHPQRGLPEIEVTADDDALRHFAVYAEGDARRALNALEIAMLTTPPCENKIHIDLATAVESLPRKLVHYDGTGDEHYDAASAFIKSMRGTDPDSALYWLAYMLEAGEDPRFIARRICIAASEDVGNADPMALVVATAAFQACELVGMPEAQIILAHATTYVACAPKSNAAYAGIAAARKDVQEGKTVAVPVHLQDAHYPGATRLGRGQGYQYAHNYDDGFVVQDYGVPPGTYYHPTDRGKELEFKKRLETFRARRETMEKPSKSQNESNSVDKQNPRQEKPTT